MARVSNFIEDFINRMLTESASGEIEIQRNVLAQQFSCSPSQINYVLETRFTPYKGYYIESRRGEGGYIRIVQISLRDEDNELKDRIIEAIGSSVTKAKADRIIEGLREGKIINEREVKILKAAVEDRALTGVTSEKNKLRAQILLNVLLVLMSEED